MRLVFLPKCGTARDLFQSFGDLAFVFHLERNIGHRDDAGKLAVFGNHGTRRTCLSPISRTASNTKSSGSHRKISRASLLRRPAESASLPSATERTTMSRSVTMPTSFPFSTTGNRADVAVAHHRRGFLQRCITAGGRDVFRHDIAAAHT